MRSMTGYSKLSYQDDKYALNMELKSVNNKNLNLKIKLPYNLNFLEGAIRTEIASKVSRGSLDLKIEFSDLRDLGKLFDYDKEQSKGYMNVLLEMEKDFNEKFSNKMDILVRNLNVIKKNDFEIDEEEYTNFILGKIKELLTPFIKTREEEGERLRIYFLERISVLEANIDEIKKLSLDDSKLNDREKQLIKENYFFACCRIDKQKDIDTLVESYKILKEKCNIKEKLYIAGVGDQKERLENLVKSYKLEKNIVFLGLQKNPYVWMKNARFFVHSSYREGLPTVVIEGLITNGMVISSDCPTGPKEILEEGKSGILFPVGDKNKLAEEIMKVLNNENLVKNYKEKAKKRIEDFSKEKIKKIILNLLNKEI